MKHNESTENSGVTVKPRYPNLKPFKPGQSGNPGGRPKGKVTSKIENILDEKVARDKEGRTYLDKLARSIVDRAIKKNDVLAKEILNRTDGPVTETEDQTHVTINVSGFPHYHRK